MKKKRAHSTRVCRCGKWRSPNDPAKPAGPPSSEEPPGLLNSNANARTNLPWTVKKPQKKKPARVGNQRFGDSALFNVISYNAAPLGWAVNLSQKTSSAFFLVPRGRGGRRGCVLLALRVRQRSERPREREARAGVNLTTEWPSRRGKWHRSPVTSTAEDLSRIWHVRYLRIWHPGIEATLFRISRVE